MTDLASALLASSQRLGIDPLDLGTAISYETAGTFDPWKAGPTTKWGQHRGLIQWGEPQRQQYGVYQGMPIDAQMRAVEKYLTDAGVRPGMGLLDVYSAINAGRVGRYNASDAAAGGAPGTVRDKVEKQMAAHRAKAQALLGGQYRPGPTVEAAQRLRQGQPGTAGPNGLAGMMAPALPPTPSLGDLVLGTLQGQQNRRAEEEQAAVAEQQRRAALFGNLGAFFG